MSTSGKPRQIVYFEDDEAIARSFISTLLNTGWVNVVVWFKSFPKPRVDPLTAEWYLPVIVANKKHPNEKTKIVGPTICRSRSEGSSQYRTDEGTPSADDRWYPEDFIGAVLDRYREGDDAVGDNFALWLNYAYFSGPVAMVSARGCPVALYPFLQNLRTFSKEADADWQSKTIEHLMSTWRRIDGGNGYGLVGSRGRNLSWKPSHHPSNSTHSAQSHLAQFWAGEKRLDMPWVWIGDDKRFMAGVMEFLSGSSPREPDVYMPLSQIDGSSVRCSPRLSTFEKALQNFKLSENEAHWVRFFIDLDSTPSPGSLRNIRTWLTEFLSGNEWITETDPSQQPAQSQKHTLQGSVDRKFGIPIVAVVADETPATNDFVEWCRDLWVVVCNRSLLENMPDRWAVGQVDTCMALLRSMESTGDGHGDAKFNELMQAKLGVRLLSPSRKDFVKEKNRKTLFRWLASDPYNNAVNSSFFSYVPKAFQTQEVFNCQYKNIVKAELCGPKKETKK